MFCFPRTFSKSFTLKMFLGKRTKYQYFNDFTSVVFNFQYDASYVIFILYFLKLWAGKGFWFHLWLSIWSYQPNNFPFCRSKIYWKVNTTECTLIIKVVFCLYHTYLVLPKQTCHPFSIYYGVMSFDEPWKFQKNPLNQQ